MHLKSVLPFFLAAAEAWTPQSRAIAKANGEKITERWLPNDDKIRGVNLGSQFIIERWMAEESWKLGFLCRNKLSATSLNCK
ncbi:hypothetical protein H9Q69_009749 [Fusarium xylarioides]|nr:hypothetical protein H9Q69_009749 [Fusarium xylarioides]